MVDLYKTARPQPVPFGLGQCKKPYLFGAMSRETKSDDSSDFSNDSVIANRSTSVDSVIFNFQGLVVY